MNLDEFRNRIEKKIERITGNETDRYQQAIREVLQETALCGLSRTDFFDRAGFTGGTALRIYHGLNRFSEDLDFSLKSPDSTFEFSEYTNSLKKEFAALGFNFEIVPKKTRSAVHSAFIKANTSILLSELTPMDPAAFNVKSDTKTKIKIEIDTNPPKGAGFTSISSDFPVPFSAEVMDIPSMYALKTHAITCRNYLKGRDYYDFIWFSNNNADININLFKEAWLQKNGTPITDDEIYERIKDLFTATENIDVMTTIRNDVIPFLYNKDEIKKITKDGLLTALNNSPFADQRQISEEIDDTEGTGIEDPFLRSGMIW